LAKFVGTQKRVEDLLALSAIERGEIAPAVALEFAELELEYARLFLTLDVDKAANAVAVAESVLAILAKLKPGDPDIAMSQARSLLQRATILARRGRSAKQSGASAKAAEAFRGAFAAFAAARNLMASFGTSAKAPTAALLRADIAGQEARALRSDGRLAEARAAFEIAIAGYRELRADPNIGREAERQLGRALEVFGDLLCARCNDISAIAGDPEQKAEIERAVALYEEARGVALRTLAVRNEPSALNDLAIRQQRLGNAYRTLGRSDLARQSYIEATSMFEKVDLAYAKDMPFRVSMAQTQLTLGNSYLLASEYEDAKSVLAAACEIFDRVATFDQSQAPSRARCYIDLAQALIRLGDRARAAELLGQAKELIQNLPVEQRRLLEQFRNSVVALMQP
jgi:tetratricopeptide (TPR) repeat protein